MVTKNRAKWTMLRTYLINFVLVLVLAGNALSTPPPYTCTWKGGSDLWSTVAKWTGGVPTIAKSAGINIADSNCRIDATVDACCSTLDVAYDTGPCYLNMTGGKLTVNGLFYVGDEPSPGATDTNGVFIMSDGNATIGGKLQIGDGRNDGDLEPVYGTLIMTNGVIHARGASVELGKNTSGNGWMYIQGGTLDMNFGSADFYIGVYGTGTIYMTDGNIIVADRLRLSSNSDGLQNGTAKIYLDGGTIYVNNAEITIGDNDSFIDISKGTLLVGGGSGDSIDQLVGENKIRGYGGDGYVVVVSTGSGEDTVTTVTARPNDPNLAWKASPRNRAIVEWTPAGPTLSWKPGQYAAQHDVYFGDDEDDVNDATDPNALPGRGRQNPCTFAFPAPPPEFDKTYYWRIDEVNDTCEPYIWKGNVWQFTMADYEEVEDFDSYANDAALKAVWTLTGGTGSAISRDTTTVRSGNSMKYVYKNNGATEAAANTTGANKLPVDINDWTTADIKALTLYFYGDVSNNSTENMYVALKSTDNNSAVVYYDNPGDLNKPEWHEWNIKLSDFTGVNLHSVANVYIGFGNRGSPPTSNGTVYFDDIRLYPSRCVALFAPEGDVDSDCNVGFVDVNIMAGDWLDTDANRKGSDGVLKGGASWVTDGTRHCVQLNGINGWVDLDDSDFSDFRNKTIAFWVKIRSYRSDYPYVFYFSDGDEDNPYRIYLQTYTPASYYVRARFVDGYSDNFTAGQDVWRHLAFVLKDTDDGRCTGEFYGDGGMVAATPMPGRPRHSGGATGVNLGSANDGSSGFVNAVFDDFRVYDRALTSAEVSALYSGGGPTDKMLLHYDFNEVDPNTVAHNSSTYEFYHPLLSDAELYEAEVEGYRVVNFKDFAILADSWLEEQLWP